MKINLKLRLKNKTTLITLLITLATALYKVLEIFNVTPAIPYKEVENLIYVVVGVLASLGIIVDPTTKGIGDSDRAMTYSDLGDKNLDLTVKEDPIDDDNEEVKTETVEDDKHVASDVDALITKEVK
jgi:phi LC3 family holin